MLTEWSVAEELIACGSGFPAAMVAAESLGP